MTSLLEEFHLLNVYCIVSIGSSMSLVSSAVVATCVVYGAYLSGQTPRNINVLLSKFMNL